MTGNVRDISLVQPAGLRALVLLLTVDAIGVFFASRLAFLALHAQWPTMPPWHAAGLLAITLATLHVAGIYRAPVDIRTASAIARLSLAVLSAALWTAIVVYVVRLWDNEPILQADVLFVAIPLFGVWAVLSRVIAGACSKALRKQRDDGRWLVLDTGEWATQLRIDLHSSNARTDLRFVVENGADDRHPHNPAPALNFLDRLRTSEWSGVIVATDSPLAVELSNKLAELRTRGVPVLDVCDFYARFLFKVPVIRHTWTWLIFSHRFSLPHTSFESRAKRISDAALSILLLLGLSPLMFLIAIAIKFEDQGPIFYTQERNGRGGKTFRLYKFRSMCQNAESLGPRWADEHDARVTWVGRLLRATHTDELPQLINVLKGDMSLIGPRPERPVFNETLTNKIPFYDLRHVVKPGITGWAQVMYRYGASEKDALEKLQYDLYYIRNYSLLLDLKILLKTIRVVALAQGR